MSRATCPFQVKSVGKEGEELHWKPLVASPFCILPPKQEQGQLGAAWAVEGVPALAGVGQDELQVPSNPNHPGGLWMMLLERLNGMFSLFPFSWEPQFYSQPWCLCCCCVTLASKSRFSPKGNRPSVKTPLENVWFPKLSLIEHSVWM